MDDTAQDETQSALEEWCRLFNAGSYFAAHEVLEAVWLRAGEPEKSWLKGLIHAAVALYQYGRANGHGARVKSVSCLRYLAGAPEVWRGLHVAALRRDVDAFFQPLQALPPGSPPPARDRPQPRITRR